MLFYCGFTFGVGSHSQTPHIRDNIADINNAIGIGVGRLKVASHIGLSHSGAARLDFEGSGSIEILDIAHSCIENRVQTREL